MEEFGVYVADNIISMQLFSITNMLRWRLEDAMLLSESPR